MRNWAEIVLDKDFAVIAKAIAEWRAEKGFDTGWGNVGEKLMLVMTEVSEACDEAENGSFLVEEIMFPCDLRKESAEEFADAVACYCEEWIDAFVRIMDLIGTLGLPRYPTEDVSEEVDAIFNTIETDTKTFEDPVDHSWNTVFGPINAALAIFVLRQMSKAMEEYRDVVLVNTMEPNQGVVPVPEQAESAAFKIMPFMYNAATACTIAVERAGQDWREHLKKKMEKNEQRPVKHGRQR